MSGNLIDYMERHEQMLRLSKYLPTWMGVRRKVRRKLEIQLGIIYNIVMLQYGNLDNKAVLRPKKKSITKEDVSHWLPDGISPAQDT